MISLDLLQFDQTNFFFLLLSAVGLIRERRILPFLLVALGCSVHGTLGGVLVAGLIFWHRVDFGRSRWVQLKDAFGFLLILMGAVAPEPFQEFCIFAGVTAISLSFGRGALGVIPPLLLLRQYVPHPDPLELILGAAGFYWVMSEAIRWSKTSQERLLCAFVEVLSTLGILYGLRDFALKSLEDTGLIVLCSAWILFVILIFAWVKWKKEKFWQFFHRSKEGLARTLNAGSLLISDEKPWAREIAEEVHPTVEDGFNRLLVLTIVALALLGCFALMSRGGFA